MANHSKYSMDCHNKNGINFRPDCHRSEPPAGLVSVLRAGVGN
jgi:hypothetical protein